LCVYAQSQFFLHSQNDTNLAVGKEETENGGERDGLNCFATQGCSKTNGGSARTETIKI